MTALRTWASQAAQIGNGSFPVELSRKIGDREGLLTAHLLLAAHPGEGRFSERTADAQAWRPELVFMLRSGR